MVVLLRILHTYKIYRPDIEGGIPTVISCLIQNPEPGISNSILVARRSGTARSFTSDGVLVEAVASLGTVFSMPLAPGYIPAFVRSVRQADVVVHHAPFPLTDAAILLGLPASVALIVYWHADIIGYPRLKRLMGSITRRVLARADKIVVSGATMIERSDALKPYAEKCEVFPYGVDLAYWRTLDATEIQQVERIRQQQPRHVVTVGRLVSYKGLEVLVRAMRDVDAKATIVGGGLLQEQLKRLAAELGVSNRIFFAGVISRSEIKILFHAAQVFALPSVTDAEAFGIVQVEAMATGLPIINTRLCTTAPWVARHHQEALTVPPNDATALAQALNLVLDQPALAQRLGASAYIRATEEFSDDIFRKRMGAVYYDAVRARVVQN